MNLKRFFFSDIFIVFIIFLLDRISKLYGGEVTCGKVKKLKSRKEATKRDVQLANWFIVNSFGLPMP